MRFKTHPYGRHVPVTIVHMEVTIPGRKDVHTINTKSGVLPIAHALQKCSLAEVVELNYALSQAGSQNLFIKPLVRPRSHYSVFVQKRREKPPFL